MEACWSCILRTVAGIFTVAVFFGIQFAARMKNYKKAYSSIVPPQQRNPFRSPSLFLLQSCLDFFSQFQCFCFYLKLHSPRPRHRFHLWKIPWRRKWQSTPVFFPGKSHGQKTRRVTVHGITKNWTKLSTENSKRKALLKCPWDLSRQFLLKVRGEHRRKVFVSGGTQRKQNIQSAIFQNFKTNCFKLSLIMSMQGYIACISDTSKRCIILLKKKKNKTVSSLPLGSFKTYHFFLQNTSK